jgi:alpha-L-rhamnosidase
MKNVNNLTLLMLAVLLLSPLAGMLHAAGLTNLRCEHLANPLGIDVTQPRLSWVIESTHRGERQTAYQILVASSEVLLKQNKGDCWDSGKVASDQSIQVEYQGKPLASRMRCYWKVRVWDQDGKASAWSEPALWTMGLLQPADWQAKWIGRDESVKSSALAGAQWIWFPEGKPAASAPPGVRYFRRTLSLPPGRKPVAATCNLTADNTFELVINGRKAAQGDNWENTVTSDVTGFLQPGENVLTITVTNAGPAPSPAGLIVKLHIQFDKGDPMDLVTDGQWGSSTDGNQWTSAKALGVYGIGPWGQGSEESSRRLPARYLRREFAVDKKVARATAYVCGLGFFDLFLNGKKVSDDLMDPALSDYAKAAYYVTFDVTEQLRKGTNAIGVMLGNGRFYAPRSTTPVPTQGYGFPKLCLQLEVEYTDGTRDEIVSNPSWKLNTAGPIQANNEYDGEEYDARLEMPGWDQAAFDDAKWEPAQVVNDPGGGLKSQMIEPMRITQIIHPVAITNPAPGVYILDMGQNFYGTVRLKAKGPRGTQVTMISAYSLKPDGMLKTADNRGAKATDVYTFKGEGEEVWNPQFKGQGYRRVQVSGFPGTPTVDNFEGLVIHTDAKPVGEFECSNDLVNRIHQAMRWGMRMYLRSAPLDPDRDERQAWMGDPAKDAESEAFNFNVAPFYTKWMEDVRQSQRKDGTIPDVAMYWTWGSGVVWASVFTIIPDWIADFYGDRNVSKSNYGAMRAWVLAIRNHELPNGTLPATDYGDWCDTYTMDGKIGDYGATPRELVSTAYQYNNCRIMQRLAKSMGQANDERIFTAMAEKLKTAFNQKFLDSKTHVYQGGTQCGYILALAFGLVPDEQRDAVIANLIDDIMVKHNGHLTVGLIGMQWLMQTLTDIGRPDVAWTIATQTTRPSWGYMLSKSATTIWERWDCDTRDPGMNSEALLIQAGNLDAWFYQTLAGINYDRQQPGFKHIVIKPTLAGDLSWVKAHFDSPFGRIVSNWKKDGNNLTMEVTIPANTTATVYVPTQDAASVTESGKPAGQAESVKFLRMEHNAAVYAIGSGNYRFQSKLPGTNE